MKLYIFQSHDLETFSLAIRCLFQEYHKRMKEKGWDIAAFKKFEINLKKVNYSVSVSGKTTDITQYKSIKREKTFLSLISVFYHALFDETSSYQRDPSYEEIFNKFNQMIAEIKAVLPCKNITYFLKIIIFIHVNVLVEKVFKNEYSEIQSSFEEQTTIIYELLNFEKRNFGIQPISFQDEEWISSYILISIYSSFKCFEMQLEKKYGSNL